MQNAPIQTGPNSTRDAINTVTLANAIAIITHATVDLNTQGVSMKLNGDTLTHASIAALVSQKLKENLEAKAMA